MLFDEANSELLKTWVIKRLETVSDADPDVLGDYVLALVSTDDPESVAKANCNENLKDFLGESSDAFVNDLFRAITTQSYNPSKSKAPTVPTYNPPRRMSLDPPRQQNESKKRGYHDWDRDESQNGSVATAYHGGERPMKLPRRGRGGFDQRGGRQQQHSAALFPQMPTPPPGMPAFDMNNPIASFMAMQQAMGLLPGFPSQDQDGSGIPQKPRCRDFDNKGYCTRGAACLYDHGTDPYIVPPNDEYDPNQATLLHVQPSRTGIVHASPSSKGRGRGRARGGNSNHRGGGKRSGLGQQGPNHDRSITTVVVEQIPEDHFEEEIVRAFFSEFGNVEKVELKPYKRLALVTYDDYNSAKAAYESPKVVFDNRFVKVYWYNPDTPQQPQSSRAQPNGARTEEDEPAIDLEEIAKKQEQAQRKHDKQKWERNATEKNKKDIDAKVKAIEAERKTMAEMLAKKSGKTISSTITTKSVNDQTHETEQTKNLRAQLAKLEAEAKSLGLDPNIATHDYDYPGYQYYRGRGGFRGRYRGRGGYNHSFRGGWQGSGVGAVKRLDNRPKTVTVTFTEGSYEDHDEALRQWLLFNAPESSTLTKHPNADCQGAALVAFAERYLGENFMAAAATPGFPLYGKVEMSWYKADVSALPAAQTVTNDTEMQEGTPGSRDMDQDDRSDDDRWG